MRGRLRNCFAPVAVALALFAAPAAHAGVVTGLTVDGPSPDIAALGGVAMAEDSSGGLVYLKGSPAAHVFVSSLTGGSWSAPVQVDAGVAGAAAQPQIAATNNGRLAVVWISGGVLYGAVRFAAGAPFSAPQAIAPALSDPSLSMGLSGTAYVSWTAPDGAGTDVDVARLDRTATSFVPLAAPLNASPSNAAGSGLLRSRVAVAADAIGIVAWGEQRPDGTTHVLLRRVFGLNESVVLIDATAPSLNGRAGHSADSAAIAVGDDSSYPWVAFRETFDNGSGQVARVVLEQVIGSELQPPLIPDSLSFPAPEGAASPALAVNGGGEGLLALALTSSNSVVGATTTPDGWTPGETLNPFHDALAPLPVAALGRDDRGIVAWQPDGGSVQGRLFEAGTAAEEVQLSRSDLGPVAAAGVSAAQDAHGDSVVAFVQGSPPRIAVAASVPPPGRPRLLTGSGPQSARPRLAWTAVDDTWSPLTYRVLLDGRQIATTGATRLRLATPLKPGVHRWRVAAVDSLGQQGISPVGILRIGGKAPAKKKKKKGH